MRITFIGTGDAFGSGGRHHSCLFVEVAGGAFLVDCGASAPVALQQRGIDPARVDAVVLTHLHGDHFAGLPFLILEAQFVSRRTRPFTIIGPQALAARLHGLMEAMFPGMAGAGRDFALDLVELTPGVPTAIAATGAMVTAHAVVHPSGAPALALRVAGDGKVLACSGDTGWTDVLVEVARDADLFVTECYAGDVPVPFHLDQPTLASKLPQLEARRILVTHMSAPMLARADALEGFAAAFDGLVVDLV